MQFHFREQHIRPASMYSFIGATIRLIKEPIIKIILSILIGTAAIKFVLMINPRAGQPSHSRTPVSIASNMR